MITLDSNIEFDINKAMILEDENNKKFLVPLNVDSIIEEKAFSINDFAFDIINYLKKSIEIREIINLIFNEYEVSKNILENDILIFLNELNDKGFLRVIK